MSNAIGHGKGNSLSPVSCVLIPRGTSACIVTKSQGVAAPNGPLPDDAALASLTLRSGVSDAR